MALLAKEAQERVVNLIVDEGLADYEAVQMAEAEAAQKNQPILASLVAKKIINDEVVAHATAIVMGVPYVNLRGIKIDQEDLLGLPQEVAERNMAVSLGEKDGRLVVAMLDVSNIQATDYLSTLTHKTIRAVMSSEEGIRSVLDQYKADFSGVRQAVKQTKTEEEIERQS